MHPLTITICGLWLTYLAMRLYIGCAPEVRAIWRALRARGWVALLGALLLLLACTLYGGSKGGVTPPDPPSVRAVINLFFRAADGRLIPLDAHIREALDD